MSFCYNTKLQLATLLKAFRFNIVLLRLQLKGALFCYGHQPKMHEIVSDGSSQVNLLQMFTKFQCMPFPIRKHEKTNAIIVEMRTQKCWLPWKHIFEKQCVCRSTPVRQLGLLLLESTLRERPSLGGSRGILRL